ncbi:MAG: glycosyltransferase family 4 protein [Oscillospiraceae bacterium]|nr:glycosyltransferase family 4 protein [Oscillospiraceae bacterium]
MRIAFDALPLLGVRTGIGWCEAGQAAALIRQHPEDRFYFQGTALRHRAEKKALLRPFLQENTAMQLVPGSRFLPHAWQFGRSADVTHFFNYIIPAGVAGKTVVTVHDMVLHAHPETMHSRTRQLLRLRLRQSMERADRIVTDSAFSCREIARYYPAYAKKVRIVPCGVDLQCFRPVTDADKLRAVRECYRTGEHYFLYLGTLEPRKNIPRLISAYAAYAGCYQEPARLVLAGAWGWGCEAIFQRIRALHLESKVVLTQYVAAEDLCALLSGAVGFVYPSLYEGFGMPPLEAMACGTPVLVSDAASLPEVVGDCALTVPAEDTVGIARGLCRLHEDAALRDRLSQAGRRRAAQFTWERSADRLYDVYREIA